MNSPFAEWLRYDPETGEFWWLKSPSNRVDMNRPAGCIDRRGYLFIRFQGKIYTGHRLAWFFIYGEWPQLDIDHIDGDPSNNRIANLREATPSQNQANKKRPSTNKSGFKGVSRGPGRRKWEARLKGQYLGTYETREEAAVAYEKAAVGLYGEFARMA